MKNCRVLLLLLLFSSLFSVSHGEILKNVRIKADGQKQYFVVFQSPVEPSVWYCGQVKPQILMRETGSEKIPEISLIRYQKKDLKNPEKLVQGAHFRMHLALGPSDNALELLRNKLPSSSRQAARLSPVPFKAIKLCLQRPDGKEIELHAESLSGISNHHSAQTVAFSTNLDILNSDLLDELLKGTTGAKYILYYNYLYADPVLTGEKVSEKEGKRDFKRNDSESGSSDRELPGSRDFDRMNREAESRAGWEKAGQGFIGFADFSRSVYEKCVFIETDASQWNKAYLSLPLIQTPPEISIEKIELLVSIEHSEKVYDSQKLIWTPKRYWRDRFGAPLVYGVFDLGKLKSEHRKTLDKANFKINLKIESNQGDILRQETRTPVIVGDSPISDPLTLADILEFQTGFLSFSSAGSKGLQKIEVSLKQAEWQSRRVIEPEFKNGKILAKDCEKWLVAGNNPKTTAPLIAEVFFVVSDGQKNKKVPWRLNGKDLRKELPGLTAIFFDQDWTNQ